MGARRLLRRLRLQHRSQRPQSTRRPPRPASSGRRRGGGGRCAPSSRRLQTPSRRTRRPRATRTPPPFRICACARTSFAAAIALPPGALPAWPRILARRMLRRPPPILPLPPRPRRRRRRRCSRPPARMHRRISPRRRCSTGAYCARAGCSNRRCSGAAWSTKLAGRCAFASPTEACCPTLSSALRTASTYARTIPLSRTRATSRNDWVISAGVATALFCAFRWPPSHVVRIPRRRPRPRRRRRLPQHWRPTTRPPPPTPLLLLLHLHLHRRPHPLLIFTQHTPPPAPPAPPAWAPNTPPTPATPPSPPPSPSPSSSSASSPQLQQAHPPPESGMGPAQLGGLEEILPLDGEFALLKLSCNSAGEQKQWVALLEGRDGEAAG